MAKKLINTEEELNRALGVNSVKEISDDKMDQLYSMIPQINPELLSKVITAIPASAEALTKLIQQVSIIYAKDYENANNNEAISAYKDILEFVKKEAKRNDLSFEEICKLKDEMKDIAVEIAKEQRRKEEIEKDVREQKTNLIKLIVEIVVIAIVTIALFIIFIFLPGVLGEIFTVIAGIVSLAIVITNYNIKKKELKQKAKNNQS